jgi:hypothetical protein
MVSCGIEGRDAWNQAAFITDARWSPDANTTWRIGGSKPGGTGPSLSIDPGNLVAQKLAPDETKVCWF